MTLKLLHFLLSLPIILTIVWGIGLGITAPSDWTEAQKTLLVGSFYLTATLLWAWPSGNIYTPDFLFLCYLLQGPLPIPLHTLNTGSSLFRNGKTWPVCPASYGALVSWSLAILAFSIPILPLPLTFWPFSLGYSGP
jgi:hypothetical protein